MNIINKQKKLVDFFIALTIAICSVFRKFFCFEMGNKYQGVPLMGTDEEHYLAYMREAYDGRYVLSNTYSIPKNNGANSISGSFALADDCRTACDTAKLDYVVCATEADQYPVANAICSQKKSVSWSKVAARKGIWGDVQPSECPGATSESKAYHYCFAAPKKAELNVSIGNQTTTLPIGDYINLLYTYSLSIAAIIAVVMIMIGGVQYVIGSGTGGEAVTAARKRITNAVTGLVLLLFAYLVLNTVNPALVKFKVLQLPLIKSSLFLTGSCEVFDEQNTQSVPK